MTKWDVTFWRKATTDDRYGITVEADTAEEAAAKVRAYYEGEAELTDEEQESEYLQKEFVNDSVFENVDGVGDEHEPRLSRG